MSQHGFSCDLIDSKFNQKYRSITEHLHISGNYNRNVILWRNYNVIMIGFEIMFFCYEYI